jgi:hypothetical protein
MTDKPKLTLNNLKTKANPSSTLFKNTEEVSSAEQAPQDQSNKQNSSSTNYTSPNKDLKNNEE